ncbi:hypothetical protein FS837_002135 [Tulasnella sp. UAMH 9824]|nr:hypothetical protein FS837_002135 [Tulasnella sp. UAMH 9824]
MSFRHRNALYLRISRHTVIPLYLYLDDKDVKWMNDKILTQVIRDMRPLILQKWREELEFKDVSGPKRKKFGVVDVYRGAFAPQTRHFSSAPRRQLIPKPSDLDTKEDLKREKATRSAKSVGQKRKRSETADRQSSTSPNSLPPIVRRSERRVTRNIPTGAYREQEEDDERELGDEEQDATPGETNLDLDDAQEADMDASTTKEVVVKTEQEDTDLASLLARASPMAAEDADYLEPQAAQSETDKRQREDSMDVDEVQEKPTLTLGYDGYTIPDVCLAIIVEPYSGSAASRAATREPSTAPGANPSRYVGLAPPSRAATEVPEEGSPTIPKKPLFRDFTPMPGDEIEEVPRFPSVAPQRTYPRVPLFHETTPGLDDDDGDSSKLIQFSQAINLGGNRLTVGEGGEDEDDADALLADADEAR